jgi:hypothetical protein
MTQYQPRDLPPTNTGLLRCEDMAAEQLQDDVIKELKERNQDLVQSLREAMTFWKMNTELCTVYFEKWQAAQSEIDALKAALDTALVALGDV